MRHTACFLALGVALALPAEAHHSVLPFDGDAPTTLTGRVLRVLWQNPHSYIVVVSGPSGSETEWTIEAEAIAVLERLGWTPTLVRVGDVVTVTGGRARDGRPLMRCATVGLATGRVLPCFPGRSQ